MDFTSGSHYYSPNQGASQVKPRNRLSVNILTLRTTTARHYYHLPAPNSRGTPPDCRIDGGGGDGCWGLAPPPLFPPPCCCPPPPFRADPPTPRLPPPTPPGGCWSAYHNRNTHICFSIFEIDFRKVIRNNKTDYISPHLA